VQYSAMGTSEKPGKTKVEKKITMRLTDYRTLGRSGLIVSPLALGTMTFGTPRWGSSDETSEAIFNAYGDAGGNFVDTADIYAGGRSEELIGEFIAKRNLRDQLALATKFSFSMENGNPNAGGNGRKNIHRALEGSLRRLQTDYIDLYWMHIWDTITPVEEVLQSLGDLQRAGKIRYFALSDVPAWYAVRAVTLAEAQRVAGPIALQMEYSLVERTIEHEHMPAARECGLGIVPWSPLAGGFLTGKYQREEEKSEGRLSGANPFGDTKFTDRNWRTLDALSTVAAEVDLPLAQVALAWVASRPGVTSTILGASRLDQLQDNIASLNIHLTTEQLQALNAASAMESSPYDYLTPALRPMIFGADVQGWR
jgi:aryl-alcohol dehydrogenase-like predicted oxidoreductase